MRTTFIPLPNSRLMVGNRACRRMLASFGEYKVLYSLSLAKNLPYFKYHFESFCLIRNLHFSKMIEFFLKNNVASSARKVS